MDSLNKLSEILNSLETLNKQYKNKELLIKDFLIKQKSLVLIKIFSIEDIINILRTTNERNINYVISNKDNNSISIDFVSCGDFLNDKLINVLNTDTLLTREDCSTKLKNIKNKKDKKQLLKRQKTINNLTSINKNSAISLLLSVNITIPNLNSIIYNFTNEQKIYDVNNFIKFIQVLTNDKIISISNFKLDNNFLKFIKTATYSSQENYLLNDKTKTL